MNTELSDLIIDVAERPETSLSDKDVLYTMAEEYDKVRSEQAQSAALIGALQGRLAECSDEATAREKQVAQLQNTIAELNARLYGIALLLKH